MKRLFKKGERVQVVKKIGYSNYSPTCHLPGDLGVIEHVGQRYIYFQSDDTEKNLTTLGSDDPCYLISFIIKVKE